MEKAAQCRGKDTSQRILIGEMVKFEFQENLSAPLSCCPDRAAVWSTTLESGLEEDLDLYKGFFNQIHHEN
jgi:hypothetical protein